MLTILSLIAGLVLPVLGGDLLVRGAVDLARRFGVSPLLIGLTLVGFGTSTPELVTSLQAAFAGSPGVAIGNVVGSNTANILLILGITAMIAPVIVSRTAFRRDALVLAGSALLCVAAVLYGTLVPLVGAGFIAALVAYLVWSVRTERMAPAAEGIDLDRLAKPRHVGIDAGFVLAGLLLTIFGARLLVTGAIDIAASLGVSETIIGLTIVAIGTSLPELVTSFSAALRKQGDVAFGNIVGSNIYNILFILGATAIIKPVQIPPSIAVVDIWVMVAATLALIGFAISGWRITRREGALLLLGYIAYTGWLVWSATSGT